MNRFTALFEQRAGGQCHGNSSVRLAPLGGFPNKRQIRNAVGIFVILAKRGVFAGNDGTTHSVKFKRQCFVLFFEGSPRRISMTTDRKSTRLNSSHLGISY